MLNYIYRPLEVAKIRKLMGKSSNEFSDEEIIRLGLAAESIAKVILALSESSKSRSPNVDYKSHKVTS